MGSKILVRTVSLVLTAAVVLCPMWCGAGWVCHIDQCSSTVAYGCADQCEDQLCLIHEAGRCCGGDLPQDDHDRVPCPCPKYSCQGICGGAVWEKSSELNDLRPECYLPLVDIERSLASLCAQSRIAGFEHGYRDCRSNCGWRVRLLYMSLLC